MGRLSKLRQKVRDDTTERTVSLKIGGRDVLGLKCLNRTEFGV